MTKSCTCDPPDETPEPVSAFGAAPGAGDWGPSLELGRPERGGVRTTPVWRDLLLGRRGPLKDH